MDNDSPEQQASPEELAQEEEKKWNDIVANESDEHGENLVSSFAILEKTVKRLTENFQAGSSSIDPASLDGLWKIFLGSRKALVEAYDLKGTNPSLLKTKITDVAMKAIDGLFHADSFSEKGSELWHTLQAPRAFIEGGLQDDYGIKTFIPSIGIAPDLSREFIVGGSGEKITKVLQPGFIELSSSRVLREAVIETA